MLRILFFLFGVVGFLHGMQITLHGMAVLKRKVARGEIGWYGLAFGSMPLAIFVLEMLGAGFIIGIVLLKDTWQLVHYYTTIHPVIGVLFYGLIGSMTLVRLLDFLQDLMEGDKPNPTIHLMTKGAVFGMYFSLGVILGVLAAASLQLPCIPWIYGLAFGTFLGIVGAKDV